MVADARRKEARKRKFGADTAKRPSSTGSQQENVAGEPANKKSKQNVSNASCIPTVAGNDETRSTPIKTDTVADDNDLASARNQRFIVFIGNLPYTATDKSINKHFGKVQPKSVRHRTDKEGGKSKGFAFLEFEGYDRMKTCLSIFHDSVFDDGISPARKLNVELTVGGGGGKSKERRNKLRDKNERLNEQRKRSALEEDKQKKISDGTKSKGRVETEMGDEKEQGVKTKSRLKHEASVEHGDIHPSRRNRMAV